MTQSPDTLWQEIIKFWFDEIDSALWFNSTPEFDTVLKDKFEQVVDAALNNEFSSWQTTAEGCLALVIVLDQFPLNIYRGEPKSFAGESISREVARKAIEQKLDQQLEGPKKAFLYLPFMHSENMADQNLSVELFEKAGLKENLRFAKHHRDIVKRFGRFPHRNEILGRENTDDELDYLKSENAFLG